MVRVGGYISNINTTFLCTIVILKFQLESELPGDLFVTYCWAQIWTLSSYSVNREQDLRVCISSKFLSDAVATDWVTCFENCRQS